MSLEAVAERLAVELPMVALVLFAVLYRVGREVAGLREDVAALRRFALAITWALVRRSALTDVEARLLRLILRPPASRSRYYTREVEARLRELLRRGLTEYTWEEVREMERIAELIRREAETTKSRKYAKELRDFLEEFELLIAIVKDLLAARDKAQAAAT